MVCAICLSIFLFIHILISVKYLYKKEALDIVSTLVAISLFSSIIDSLDADCILIIDYGLTFYHTPFHQKKCNLKLEIH